MGALRFWRPKEDTIADLWRMIWEQKVLTVILAHLKERKEDVSPVLAESGLLDLRERARGSGGLRHPGGSCPIQRCRQDATCGHAAPFHQLALLSHRHAQVTQCQRWSPTGRFTVIVGMMDKMHAEQEMDAFGFV